MATWDEERFGEAFFEQIVEYIRNKLTPGDVFDDKELIEYVEKNFEPKDIYDLEDYGYTLEDYGYTKE